MGKVFLNSSFPCVFQHKGTKEQRVEDRKIYKTFDPLFLCPFVLKLLSTIDLCYCSRPTTRWRSDSGGSD